LSSMLSVGYWPPNLMPILVVAEKLGSVTIENGEARHLKKGIATLLKHKQVRV
jgi:hypothetical protein